MHWRGSNRRKQLRYYGFDAGAGLDEGIGADRLGSTPGFWAGDAASELDVGLPSGTG